MAKLNMGPNIQQLCRIYEPVTQDPPKNYNLKPTRSVIFCHLLFTLTIIAATVIFATIIEYERELNTTWKILLRIIKILEKMVFKESVFITFWNDLSAGEKIFSIITSINIGVYLAWDVAKWKSIMLKYFIINEDNSNSVWSHLLSAFSHTSLWNLLTNIIYLYPLSKSGFIRTWPLSIFPPYMGVEEFFVMYISACLISSLSRIHIERKFNRSVNKYGASGAISAIFGYVGWAFPNKQLSITIIQTSINAKSFQALLCLLLLLIVIGFVQKWSWINSISIITGCIFGIFWYEYGSKIIWQNRKYLMNLLKYSHVN